MHKYSQLFEALMSKAIQPDLSKSAHRQILEEVADNMLKKDFKVVKDVTDYSKTMQPHEYLLAKQYNKRMGHEAARTKAEFAKEHAPKTRIFSQQELETKYKPWHEAHQRKGESAELRQLMDDIDDTRELYLNAPTYESTSDPLSDLLVNINELAAAHGGDGNALRDVLANKTQKMNNARELYKAMYESGGSNKIRQLQLLSKRY